MFRKIVTDVFFDLDHTLWDFEKNSALTFEKIFLENDISIDLDDFLEIYIPQNLAFWKLYREERISKTDLRYQRLKTVFDLMGSKVSDEAINLISDEYIAHLSSFNHLFPGTLEILDYLKGRYRLHIITNGFQEIQEKKMRNSNIHSYFDKIINSEMAGVKKPNPIIFELALKTAEVVPEKSLMIGDNLEADIMGAQAVGFHTLHFNAHGEPRHALCPAIEHLHEIKTYL
ncbi:MAG: YjjG family noncanonical pyrimidine nucleotidase [Aurantibacter sp.]